LKTKVCASEFLNWYTNKLGVTYRSVVPDIFYVVISDIFVLLGHLRENAAFLNRYQNHLSSKIAKFIDQCIAFVDEICHDFPQFLDYSSSQNMLLALSKGLSQLETQSHVLRTGKIGDDQDVRHALRELQQIIPELPMLLKTFHQTISSYMPILKHLEALKDEVKQPLAAFLELVTRSIPERGAGDAIAAASAREDAERRIHQLCSSSIVRATLRLEQEINALRARIEEQVAPFVELARCLERKKARVRSSGISLPISDIKAIQTTLGLLTSEKPYLFARMLSEPQWLPELAEALQLCAVGAEAGYFTVSRREFPVGLIQKLQSFDAELMLARVGDWEAKLQEQQKLMSLEEFHRTHQELELARKSLSSSAKLYEEAISDHQKSISIYNDITTSFQSLRELIEHVCEREFSLQVELTMPETH